MKTAIFILELALTFFWIFATYDSSANIEDPCLGSFSGWNWDTVLHKDTQYLSQTGSNNIYNAYNCPEEDGGTGASTKPMTAPPHIEIPISIIALTIVIEMYLNNWRLKTKGK